MGLWIFVRMLPQVILDALRLVGVTLAPNEAGTPPLIDPDA